jgi:hypothetical protein
MLAWVVGVLPAALFTGTVFGMAPAALTVMFMLAPLVFLWALNRRSAVRIRGLNPPGGRHTHTPGSANRATKG